MITSNLSLYLHIPFCKTRCTYCAFNTYADKDALIAPYVQAMCAEIEAVTNQPLHTIYLGGGTPSLLSGEQVHELLVGCRFLPDAEISLEANPGTVSHDTLRDYHSAGVNRLSLGVQSIHAGELALFGRQHSFRDALASYEIARTAGFENINLDLIYGIPGQTLSGWQATLNEIIALNPEHISLYSLSIEPGTSLFTQVKEGTLSPPDSDLAAEMYLFTRDRLARAGFIQYEISNWARPGFECQHNRQYWLNEPFLGVGAGAYGAVKDIRYWNVRHIESYITRIENHEGGSAYSRLKTDYPVSPALYGSEHLDSRLQMAETMILNLRLVQEGVNREKFRMRFGMSVEDAFGDTLSSLLDRGWLVDNGEAVRLAESMILLSNQVFMEFLD